jgi:hypothetical protein
MIRALMAIAALAVCVPTQRPNAQSLTSCQDASVRCTSSTQDRFGDSPPSIVTIQASGAQCDGTTDDTVKINTLLAALDKGGLVTIPAGSFCLIASADLVIPPSVRVAGGGGPVQPMAGGKLAGSGFLLNPAYTISMRPGAQLDDIAVIRAALKVNPTPEEIKSTIAMWGSERSVGVSIPPNTGGVLLSRLFIEGFNTAIFSQSGQFSVRTVFADDYNGIETGPYVKDNFTITDIKLEPFYAMNVLPSTGAWARPGIGINLHGGAAELSKIFTIPWANGLVVNNHSGVLITNSNFEWQTAWGNGIKGATGIRLIGDAGHISVTDTTITTYDIPVSVESFGVARLINIAANTSSTTGPDFYLGGQSAVPTTITIQGKLAAGDSVAATITSSAFSGNRVTATYTIRPGDTAEAAATGLAQAVDHIQTLISSHVAAISSDNVVTIYWPYALDVEVTSAVTSAYGNSFIVQSTTKKRAGSFGSIIGADANGVMTVPVFQASTNTGHWNIVAPYFDKPIRNGWLSVASPNTGAITLSGIPWSNITSSNLSSCGVDPRVEPGSNDGDGQITEGPGATGCNLRFTTPFYKPPLCLLVSPNGERTPRYRTSATELRIDNVLGSGQRVIFHCQPF